MKKIITFIIIGLGFAGVALFGATRGVAKPAVAPAPTIGYVALGDSVAAGVGLETDSDSSACNRTDQSYPHQLANLDSLKLHNLACSGATVAAGILGSQDVNQLAVAPQLDQLFALDKPQYVSLTIGANDVDWTSVIGRCYTAVCGTAADTATEVKQLSVLAGSLKTVFDRIAAHYTATPPTVIVTGYYQVMPATTSTCSDLSGLDATEQTWLRAQQAKLSDTIQGVAARYSFARFVPLDFTGHELCAADAWVQGLSDKQPYHPTEAGQAAIAKVAQAAMKAGK